MRGERAAGSSRQDGEQAEVDWLQGGRGLSKAAGRARPQSQAQTISEGAEDCQRATQARPTPAGSSSRCRGRGRAMAQPPKARGACPGPEQVQQGMTRNNPEGDPFPLRAGCRCGMNGETGELGRPWSHAPSCPLPRQHLSASWSFCWYHLGPRRGTVARLSGHAGQPPKAKSTRAEATGPGPICFRVLCAVFSQKLLAKGSPNS